MRIRTCWLLTLAVRVYASVVKDRSTEERLEAA